MRLTQVLQGFYVDFKPGARNFLFSSIAKPFFTQSFVEVTREPTSPSLGLDLCQAVLLGVLFLQYTGAKVPVSGQSCLFKGLPNSIFYLTGRDTVPDDVYVFNQSFCCLYQRIDWLPANG
jgi:hypothetical protein